MEENLNEQVTQPTEEATTQPVEKPTEEKTEAPVSDTENTQTNVSPSEEATTDVKASDDNVTPTEDKNSVEGKLEVSDEIQKKLDRLAEYEVKDKELNDLKDRLGVKEKVPDNQVFSAQQELAILENQVQQEYIRLCNEYGVDYRPEKIEASGKELLEKDPKRFYELRYRLEGLNQEIDSKRAMVENFVHQKDIQSALARNQEILKASPAVGNVINYYLQQGNVTGADIDTITKFSSQIMQEAFEMGKQFAMNQSTQPKPAEVLNNTTISQQAPANPPTSPQITLADVVNMDMETYKKHQKEIDKLFLS